MKVLFTSIIFASVFFLIIDVIWLTYSVKSFYRPNLGNLLNDKPVIWAAILFYLTYVLGLSILVLYPSLNEANIAIIFFKGLVFGVVCYGTYNLTNMATIKDWSSKVVIVDMVWGGLLTGFSSSSSIFFAKKFFLT